MLPIRNWIRKHRKTLTIGLLLLVSYLGIYAALSAAGEYRPLPSGKLRWSFGFAIMDRALWQPKGMSFARQLDPQGKSKTRGDLLGYFYAPLILVDRAYWHPTIQYFPEETAGLSR